MPLRTATTSTSSSTVKVAVPLLTAPTNLGLPDERRLSCFRREIGAIGNRLFVFKWKNPEHWLTPITRGLWQTLARLRSS